MPAFTTANGYLDGIVRGFRGALLTTSQYNNLANCDTLEDLRVQLATTDYGDMLSADPKLDIALLRGRLQQKLVEQFKYLRDNATDPSTRHLLDYLQFNYMIDNVIMLVAGTGAGAGAQRAADEQPDADKDGSVQEEKARQLIEQCHPLGHFDALPALSVAGGEEVQWSAVLQESPVGRYFAGLSLDIHIELLRALAWKRYVQDFNAYCVRAMDRTSGQIMTSLLERESERRTLAIAVNSIGASLGKEDRARLFPDLGLLFTEGIGSRLARSDDIPAIRAAIDSHPLLAHRFSHALDPDATCREGGGSGLLEECLCKEEVEDCKAVFEFSSTYAVFYAWCRLKEQECKNIVWIAECIAQRHKDHIHDYIPLW